MSRPRADIPADAGDPRRGAVRNMIWAAAHAGAADVTFEVKTVVVVDDDGDVRENLQEILEREGFSVFSAKDGREALRLIEQCRGRCLIVLDLLMPEMDGWEFLERQLAYPGAGSGRPIVVVSGAIDAQRALRMPGVVAVLMKPFELTEFVATVREHCQPI